MAKGKLDEPAPAGDVFESLIDRTMTDRSGEQRGAGASADDEGDTDAEEIDDEDDDEDADADEQE